MEAGIVIVAGNLVETQVHVEPRPDPFATIDSAGFERRYDFAAGHVHNGGTQPRRAGTGPCSSDHRTSDRPASTYARTLCIVGSRAARAKVLMRIRWVNMSASVS